MKFIIKSSNDIQNLLKYLRTIEQTEEITQFRNELIKLNHGLSEIKNADRDKQIEFYKGYKDTYLKDADADIEFSLGLFMKNRGHQGPGRTLCGLGKKGAGSKTAKKRTPKIKYNIVLTKSNRPEKRYKVTINDENIVHFGSMGRNFTMHKDKKIKTEYIKRHKKHETWTLAGIKTPGFWSKHLLWNKPSMKESLAALRKRYKSIKIILSRN
jgi:hypothetical protein